MISPWRPWRDQTERAGLMNERVSNPQADDVLSSIRRLVADEPEAVRVPVVDVLRQTPPLLKLTPAQRVEPLRLLDPVQPAAPLRLHSAAPPPRLLLVQPESPTAPQVDEVEEAPIILDAVSLDAEPESASEEKPLSPIAAAIRRHAQETESEDLEEEVVRRLTSLETLFAAQKSSAVFEEELSLEQSPQDSPSELNWTETTPKRAQGDDMRELVRSLLREELQGEMGERITRNLRKMVRAELARAFASRDAG